ncbi:hypothetical protein AQJ46_10495 [Streptomyces canus]|uniref:Uncharacterized protein n=1 Tax=Streptomyces canus TaxID=58343 RepID=A0A117R5W8_9ACTN|nr:MULTISPECIES: hypothetical protein [Streptomyces]KUN72826.1 hypothetical protein AQJ46_10495 [Streptomyces canus]MDI5905336.1 hypothetical protein [Streptomyces sp. 12257]
MSAENETYDTDALMAAITGEELGDEARADAVFLAEYRAAEADVALLREQLGILGETLAAPPTAPKPVPLRPSRARRRARALAFGTLAAAAVAGVVTGLGWLAGHNGVQNITSGASDDSGASKAESGVRFGSPRYLACATTVAEGEVTAVKELPATGELQVTVDVSHYFEKTRDLDHVTYVISEYDLPEPLTKGTRVLFGVSEGSPSPDHWVVGEQAIARERAWITASLPESRTLSC